MIELINLGGLTNLDLGLVANSSLEYLGEVLEREHKVEAISLGESTGVARQINPSGGVQPSRADCRGA